MCWIWDFWPALIPICVKHPPVSLSHTGRLLILQEPLQSGTSKWTQASSRGDSGVKEGRQEGLGANPEHDQCLRSLRQAALLPRLLHLIYLLPFKAPLSPLGDSWGVVPLDLSTFKNKGSAAEAAGSRRACGENTRRDKATSLPAASHSSGVQVTGHRLNLVWTSMRSH